MLCTYFGLSARKLPPKRGALSSPDGADVKDDMEPNSAPGVGNGNGGDSAREERLERGWVGRGGFLCFVAK
jgi:hypothetical protein